MHDTLDYTTQDHTVLCSEMRFSYQSSGLRGGDFEFKVSEHIIRALTGPEDPAGS